MNRAMVATELAAIRDAGDFSAASEELVNGWSAAGAGIETVEPILRFLESNPELDVGSPGPLVHFVERFYGHGYESMLIASVERRPTPHTVWILNRVINGTKDAERRGRLIGVLRTVANEPAARGGAAATARRFLDRLGG